MADHGPADSYPAFRKIPRFYREVIVTEKIDGTNGLVFVDEDGSVRAGSRNRWLTLDQDNFGFARWVQDNVEGLAELGPGHHYGEWYGRGIQRGYGLGERRFSLFNVGRWFDPVSESIVLESANTIPDVDGLTVVPVLARGVGELPVQAGLITLETMGSQAEPSYMNPEGVVVFHTAANAYFKVTLDDDAQPKAAVKAVAA
jgi:hypothetical protein